MAIIRDENGKVLPGSVLNPNGRPPKEWTMSTLIQEALEEEAEKGTPVKKQIARKLAHMALQGDIQAIKEVNDRIDGKARQTLDANVDVRDLTNLIKVE